MLESNNILISAKNKLQHLTIYLTSKACKKNKYENSSL